MASIHLAVVGFLAALSAARPHNSSAVRGRSLHNNRTHAPQLPPACTGPACGTVHCASADLHTQGKQVRITLPTTHKTATLIIEPSVPGERLEVVLSSAHASALAAAPPLLPLGGLLLAIAAPPAEACRRTT